MLQAYGYSVSFELGVCVWTLGYDDKNFGSEFNNKEIRERASARKVRDTLQFDYYYVSTSYTAMHSSGHKCWMPARRLQAHQQQPYAQYA